MVAALVVSAGACSGDGDDSSTDTPSMDVSLLRTADSLETLAVQTYDKITVSGVVTTPAVVDLLKLLRDHHDEHRQRLATATEDAGGERYGKPNPFAQERVIDPVLPTLADEAGVLGLLAIVEAMLAETYAVAAAVFSAPDLRLSIMAIGGAEARHVAAVRLLQKEPGVAAPFIGTGQAIGPQAYV